jgi:hypothetical protein
MESLKIERGKSSPEVSFDAASGLLRLRGESFPENAVKFYAPVMEWFKRYLDEAAGRKTVVEIELVYFNSSTSKVLMNLLQAADDAAAKGEDISIRWICDDENETAVECGEEFKEDIVHASFEISISKKE